MIKERFTGPSFAFKASSFVSTTEDITAGRQGLRFRVKKDRNTETPLLEMRSGVFNCKGILNKKKIGAYTCLAI